MIIISTKIVAMCQALVVLHCAQGQFTQNEVVAKLRKMGHSDTCSNMQARLNRLVTKGVVVIANELAANGGAEKVFTILPEVIMPYMAGDREGYMAALNNTAQPELFRAWGISIPDSVHMPHPKAQVHKHSWNA